jgi:glucokinase
VTGELALAVDIGGTKLEVGLVDLEGAVVRRARVATPAREGAEDVFGALAGLVAEVLDDGADPVVCGVGTGGPMTRGGAAVSPINIPAWRGFPLHDRLAELTEVPTFVDNDAKALALGEGWLGAAKGCDDYVAMVVSTGVGGGIVLDGRLLDGADGNAGHIGHMVVVPDGHVCGCGARGCLEAEASGTAIAAITGRPAAEAGPEMVERTGTLVGRAVASVANLLDLRLAVVAGSVALGFGEPFFAAAQAEVDGSARLDFSIGTVIRPGQLAADGPLVGAAAVGWRGLGVSLGR